MIEKLGRNDRCPCGSGKKYKKCCERNVVFMDTYIETELNQIQSDFVRWATRTYKDEISDFMAPYYAKIDIPEEAKQPFHFFACLWYISIVEKEGKTLLELYLEKNKKHIKSERILHIVESWINAAPAVFLIRNWVSNEYVVTENIFTNEIKWVKSLENHHAYREQGLGIGTILPVESGYTFLTTFFYVPAQLEQIEDAVQTIQEAYETNGYESEKAFMQHAFMDILQFLMLGAPLEISEATHEESATSMGTSTESLQGIEAEVLDAFTSYARGRQKDEAFISRGRSLWAEYCELEKVTLRKPQVAAAALFYLVEEILSEKETTQSQLAKDFFISATSISSRYKQLAAVLQK